MNTFEVYCFLSQNLIGKLLAPQQKFVNILPAIGHTETGTGLGPRKLSGLGARSTFCLKSGNHLTGEMEKPQENSWSEMRKKNASVLCIKSVSGGAK